MRILHLEDNPDDAELVRHLILEQWPGCDIACVSTRQDFEQQLHGPHPDLILSDFALNTLNGLDALKLAKKEVPEVPFIFLSGTIGEDRAIEAVQSGASDYVLKDRMKRLVTAITRALHDSEVRRKQHEAESRSRELAKSLDQAREAVIATDLQGRITFWNQGAQRLFERSTEDALGQRCHALFSVPAAAQFQTGCEVASERGEWLGEVELGGRPDQPRIVELRVTSIRGENAAPRGWLVFALDITERRAAELRIREQAMMLNQAAEAIFIVDPSHKVVFWNSGAERLFGWPGDEVISRPVDKVFDLQVLGRLYATGEDVLARGQWQGEVQMQNRSGKAIMVESRQSLIRDDTGRIKGRLFINSDITDRKRLEEQFLRAQRMENIGLLAAGIAHDLNNMLAPILLAASMLKEHVSDQGAVTLLETLEKSAERGANLVRQILSFAHGTSSQPQLIQVKHLLRDITAVISGTFPKSIRLEDFIPPDLWPIRGNATQVHQVLLNLTVNARDAMPNGGILRLRAENRVLDASAAREIAGARTGAFLVLHVEDTGMGIAPEVLSRMWEPFFTTKDVGKGTGLGLSTVRSIVQNHSGFIDVQTTLGKGTAFHVYLPAEETAVTAQQAAPPRVLPPGRGEWILVVDDEEDIRETTRAMLSKNGYNVIVAANGADALVMFARHAAEIRLVITDLHMPTLDGAMLGSALRRLNPDAKLLVISGMSSALGNRSDYRPEEFADGFLHKPFRPETLLSRVLQLLRPTEFKGSAPPFPFAR